MKKVKQLSMNWRKFLLLQVFFTKIWHLFSNLELKLANFPGQPEKLKMELVLKKKTYNLNEIFLESYLKNPIVVWSNSFLKNLNFSMKLNVLIFQDQIVSKFLMNLRVKCNESRKVCVRRFITFTNTYISTFLQVAL